MLIGVSLEAHCCLDEFSVHLVFVVLVARPMELDGIHGDYRYIPPPEFVQRYDPLNAIVFALWQ